MQPNVEQAEALELIAQWASSYKKEFILKGRAGTGKTTTTRWSNLPQTTKRETIGVAMVHKAVEQLRQQLSLPCQTLASITGKKKVYDLENGLEEFLSRDNRPNYIKGILVIDEASMVSKRDHQDILKLYPNCKVLYLGDPYQLPPIKGESFLLANNDNIPQYSLTINQRSGEESPLIDVFNDIIDKIIITEKTGKKAWFKPKENDKLIINQNESSFWTDETTAICFTNKRRQDINDKIRLMYGYEDQYVIGDRMIFNETLSFEELDGSFFSFYNGTTFNIDNLTPRNVKFRGDDFSCYMTAVEGYGINLPTYETKKRVNAYIDKYYRQGNNEKDKRKRRKAFALYFAYKELFPDIDYGYCITSHKSQGSTFDNVIVEGKDIKQSTHYSGHSNMLRSLYVALSRTKDKVNLIW